MKPDLQRIEAALEAARQAAGQAQSAVSIDGWLPAIASEDTGFSTLSGTVLEGYRDRPQPSLPFPQVEQRPNLPEFAIAAERHHPFVALTNSALATNLLKDLQVQVQTWVVNLEAILQQIQVVYEEGPLVDGWLESFNADQPAATGYRLCGLAEDGQVWSRPCPPSQVPDISLAIVRYQRLQTLLRQKQQLESLLGRLTESLVDLHGKLTEPIES